MLPHTGRTVIGVTAMTLLTSLAQAQGYEPTYRNPHGTELVAVFVSSSFCASGRVPGLREALDSLKLILKSRAQVAGREFRIVGVALDWVPDSGLAYLKGFGAFDELDVGRNWFSFGAERVIWADSAAVPDIPQLVVYEQTVTAGSPRVAFRSPHVVKRVHGGNQIVEWVRGGARIP